MGSQQRDGLKPGLSVARVLGRLAVVVGLSGLTFAGAPAAQAGQGTGNPVLTVNPSSMSGGGTVQVTGRDYLVPPSTGGSVPGGVYLFFGYVEGSNWGPSSRSGGGTQGQFGGTYFYPGSGGSATTRGSSGSMAMISFSPSAESSHTMDTNGNWSAPLTISGSTFTSTLPNGQSRTFDCRTVTCGVFTIGAMGNASRTNEKFTPISFNGAGGAPQMGAPQNFQQPPMGFQQPQMGYQQPQMGYQQPPMNYPPQQQFAPPMNYAPPQQYAPPPPQQAPAAAAPTAPKTTAPTPSPTTAASSSLVAAGAEEETSAAPASLVPQKSPEGLEGRNVAAAGTFGDDPGSGSGSVLLLGLAVLAGGGFAIGAIRMLSNGTLGRGLGTGPPPAQ